MDHPDQLPFVAPTAGAAADPPASVDDVLEPDRDPAGDHPADDGDLDFAVTTDVDPGTGADAAPVAPPAARPSFQAAAGIQGRQFAEQCDTLLAHLGYELHGRRVLPEVGVEIDQEAVGPAGTVVWFEYKGSVQGSRPGLRRTDTMKKAIANGALLRALPDPSPYVVITSHLPEAGSGAAMLAAAQDLRYLADVVCLYDPAATARLRRW